MNETLMKEALGIDPRLLAIDPEGCGCTECLIGEYLPMEHMEGKHVLAMSLGLLVNNTGYADPIRLDSLDFGWRTYYLSDL